MDRRELLGAAAALSIAGAARGQSAKPTLPWPAGESLKLWPGRPPGSPATLPMLRRDGPEDGRELWLRGVGEPTVTVYRPARPNGIGVLTIPGGGYGFVSIENEGVNVARALTPFGFTVFALAYRLPGEGWARRADVPLQDAQRAMRLIRARGDAFGIDVAKLGTVGFSAGGHLAASLAVGHADPVYTAVDAADTQSAAPAFSGLIYAVTALTINGTYNGSAKNLLGPDPDRAAIERYDTVRRVTTTTAPMFLLYTADDPLVPLDMGLAMLGAGRAAKVPVEAHLYASGGHGFGVARDPAHPAHGWTGLFAAWVGRQRQSSPARGGGSPQG